jgi:hypothetical protein
MKDLLLVRLPKIPDTDQEFFGVGYYSDSGFIFCLLTEDIVNQKALRQFPFPKDTGYDSSNHFEILGTIKNLKK